MGKLMPKEFHAPYTKETYDTTFALLKSKYMLPDSLSEEQFLDAVERIIGEEKKTKTANRIRQYLSALRAKLETELSVIGEGRYKLLLRKMSGTGSRYKPPLTHGTITSEQFFSILDDMYPTDRCNSRIRLVACLIFRLHFKVGKIAQYKTVSELRKDIKCDKDVIEELNSYVELNDLREDDCPFVSTSHNCHGEKLSKHGIREILNNKEFLSALGLKSVFQLRTARMCVEL